MALNTASMAASLCSQSRVVLSAPHKVRPSVHSTDVQATNREYCTTRTHCTRGGRGRGGKRGSGLIVTVWGEVLLLYHGSAESLARAEWSLEEDIHSCSAGRGRREIQSSIDGSRSRSGSRPGFDGENKYGQRETL